MREKKKWREDNAARKLLEAVGLARGTVVSVSTRIESGDGDAGERARAHVTDARDPFARCASGAVGGAGAGLSFPSCG